MKKGIIEAIEHAYTVAKQQNEDREKARKKYIDDICDEVLTLLQKQIEDGFIHNGSVRISTNYKPSDDRMDGNCGWPDNMSITSYEGDIVAKRIEQEYHVECKYHNIYGIGKFVFNFNK